MLVKSVTYLVLLSSVLSACVATPPISTPPKKPTAIVNPSVPVAPPIIKQESSIATGTNISPLLPTVNPTTATNACFFTKHLTKHVLYYNNFYLPILKTANAYVMIF